MASQLSEDMRKIKVYEQLKQKRKLLPFLINSPNKKKNFFISLFQLITYNYSVNVTVSKDIGKGTGSKN